MKQSRWSLSRYQRPQLMVQDVRTAGDTLELQTEVGVFRLQLGDVALGDSGVLEELSALRHAGSEAWGRLRRSSDTPDLLTAIVTELDYAGLIRESLAPDLAPVRRGLSRMLHSWSAELGDEIAQRGPATVPLVDKLGGCLTANLELPVALAAQESNFALVAASLQGRYLRANSPALLAILVAGLSAATRRARLGASGRWWSDAEMATVCLGVDDSGVVLEERTVRRYLAGLSRLARLATSATATRRVRDTAKPASVQAGINFLVELEGDVRRWLTMLGSPATAAAAEGADLALRVVRSAYLQEYLVTCRFVDCIAPLLSKGFPPSLRGSVHSYFLEEVGHEHFERQNCIRLGVSHVEVDAAEPLPLHLVFVDILTALARELPIAFFCSSMFTEGMIGSSESLLSLVQQALPNAPELSEALGDHLAVNEESDHRGVGRDFMSHVDAVPAATQVLVRDLMAFMCELNFRMWEDLVATSRARAS